MAGGYTPAFASLYTGTLYGKWPTAPVWASLLPLIDSHGHIEMTYEAISGMTGWPLDLLRTGIADLMQPDAGSRSGAEDGKRLVLLDPARSWGWRAVNVQKYRDKASGRSQVDDGRNAEKVRKYKSRHRGTPVDTGGHRATPRDTYSDSDSDSDSNKDKNKSAAGAALVVLHESLPTEEWEQWMALRRKRRWPTDSLTLKKQLEVLRERDTETQRQIINASINSGWQGLFPPKGAAKKAQRDAPTTAELEARESARARS